MRIPEPSPYSDYEEKANQLVEAALDFDPGKATAEAVAMAQVYATLHLARVLENKGVG